MRESGSQGQGPEQVTLPRVPRLYFPGVHATQLDTTSPTEALEKPALHPHEKLAPIESECIGQALHKVPPDAFWKVPGGQEEQVEAPLVAAYVPVRHSVHRGKYGRMENLPASHVRQLDAPSLEKPALH